jgi:LysR family hydrogen peroxide-inducible transcriptional activator
MTLTQLSYIVAVDKYRHFATAAEKSYVTQPTLSMQIHKLEDELGVTIFDRSKSPVIPTEIGEKIIEQAKSILKESKELTDIANWKENELKGSFKVGIIPTIAPYLVPLFLRSFLKRYPKIDLVFEELLTNEVLDKLGNDQLDAAIIATPAEQSFIYSEDLYVEPFLGYLSMSHPLIEKEKLSVDDLDQSNIWLLNEGHCFRDQAVKLCKEQNRSEIRERKSAIEFKSGNLETLKKLVEQNFGMTLLPWTAVSDFDSTRTDAEIKEFEDPVPSRKVRLVYGRKHLKQTIISAFRDSICNSIPKELKTTEKRVLIE